MNSVEIIYYLFAAGCLGSAILMLLTKNVLRAAFLLLICLVSLSGIYIVYQAYFAAVVQLLVYAGGVVVLLSFGIMLSNRSNDGRMVSKTQLVFPAVIVSVLFAAMIIPLFQINKQVEVSEANDVQSIGRALMTEYIVMFEVIGFLLLVVLVGASLYANTSAKES